MNLSQSIQEFVAQDDLVFDLPDDRTAMPEQNYGETANSLATPTKRQWQGRFSWMATLAPKDGNATDQYILSIIVFHRRDTTMTMAYGGGQRDPPDNERLVRVAQFYGLGFGGGDVQLQTIRDQRSDLEIKGGEWVMLSARVDVDENRSTYPTSDPALFRWYRVLSVDGDIQGTGPYTRDVTLQGLDWTRSEWFVIDAASKRRTTTPFANYPTQVTLLSNVVAVYEKTIRLETSSLWTVQ